MVEPSDRYLQKKICERQFELIKESKKPYIFVGGGAVISEASEELYEFVKKVDAPVTDSLMGKGAFPGNGSADIPECLECMEPKHPITESANVIF